MFAGWTTVLSLQRDNPELLRAQLDAFSRQIPLLYFTLLVNFYAVAATHVGVAPAYLTVLAPIVLSVVCLGRVVLWWRTRYEVIAEETAHRRLRSVVVLGIVLGVCFVAWSFAVFPYGDSYQKAHVAFFMAITVIACIFCLMHVRQAAFALTAVVVLPFSAYFGSSGNAVFLAMAVNLTLVAFAMGVILLANYRTFAEMVASRKELIARQVETQRLSDENLRLANLDSLTDLPNRRSFFTRLHAEFESSGSKERPFSVALIDLDGFKPVNDLFGHSVGDKVLIEVSRRILEFAGEDCFVARLGGDEFGLIITDRSTRDSLIALGSDICARLGAPYVMPEATANISGSIGFAVYPEDSMDPAGLVERADYALYHAKQESRGLPVVFSGGLETKMRELSEIEHELRQSDLDRDLSVLFQPVMDVSTGRVASFEALARWHTSQLGNVSPDVFIRIAERSDMINRLTAVLLRKTLDAAALWPSDVFVSFNLSMRDLTSEVTLLRIVSIIQKSSVHPSRIVMEITETALMRDFELAARSLSLLKSLGIKIALDDFGTGYSSLGYVHRLPLDRIKIDRSFIVNIADDPVSRSIVKTVLDLCANLDVDCVVEGVETEDQVSVLGGFGCRLMQGYRFARPMTIGDSLRLLGVEEIAVQA